VDERAWRRGAKAARSSAESDSRDFRMSAGMPASWSADVVLFAAGFGGRSRSCGTVDADGLGCAGCARVTLRKSRSDVLLAILRVVKGRLDGCSG
jgi:hypothetical protein